MPRAGRSIAFTGGVLERGGTAASDRTVVWHFRHLDHDEPFGWHVCDRETLVRTILVRARSLETMSWRELREQDLLHHYRIDKVCPEARRRLEQIGQADIDELYSLRIEKRRRVWGVRDRLYFRVLWWDPDHAIHPMNITGN